MVPEPTCTCCHGTGSHEYRPFLHASPYDTDAECSFCSGTGRTWLNTKRRERCPAYHELLIRSNQR